MKRLLLVSILIPSLANIFCSARSTSTGIVTAPRRPLPPGVPLKVGVAPFTGDQRIRDQAADQFSTGLLALGFEVVERRHIEPVLSELAFQQEDWVNPSTRQRLAEQLGLQGIFVGSVTGESSVVNIDTHLNLKLVEVASGRVVWAAEAHDPRKVTWSMDVRTSIVHTVKKALQLLEKDLHVSKR